MSSTTAREELHKLVEQLPEDQAVKAASYVRYLLTEPMDVSSEALYSPLPLMEKLLQRPGRTNRLLEMTQDIADNAPAEELAKIPTDASRRIDDYLYRTAKTRISLTSEVEAVLTRTGADLC
jgi:hypothetical protein